jgi:hypothetical protein
MSTLQRMLLQCKYEFLLRGNNGFIHCGFEFTHELAANSRHKAERQAAAQAMVITVGTN